MTQKPWRILKVYSHPRSGANWLLALLGQAFYGDMGLVFTFTGHWSERVPVEAPDRKMRGGHDFYRAGLRGPRVYLYRDGRDVALSLWRTKAFQRASWHDLSFSEFLRRPLDWHGSPSVRANNGLTIAEHWWDHLNSWQDAPGTCFVSYERLLLHTEAEIARIATFVGREPLPGPWTAESVGPYPSGDYRVAKWREAFSGTDVAYFFSKVPDNHWGLWWGDDV